MEELQNIQDYIHVIRGHRVMLDRDIATFYGVAAEGRIGDWGEVVTR